MGGVIIIKGNRGDFGDFPYEIEGFEKIIKWGGGHNNMKMGVKKSKKCKMNPPTTIKHTRVITRLFLFLIFDILYSLLPFSNIKFCRTKIFPLAGTVF